MDYFSFRYIKKIFVVLMVMFLMLLSDMVFSSDSSSYESMEIIKFVVLPERNFYKDEYTLFTVKKINDLLSENNLEYIEPDVVEKTREKLSSVYEEKAGEGMSLSQLLCSSVGGSIYIEVSTKVEIKNMESSTTSYSGVPSVNVKQCYIRIVLGAFDSSTGRGLGKTIISTNVAFAGNTSQQVERFIGELSYKGMEKLLEKIKKYLEGGKLISIKVIGIKDSYKEKNFFDALDGIPGLKIKIRKSISENYFEYDVIFKGNVDNFINDLRDLLLTYPDFSKFSINKSENLIILNFK